MPSAVPKPGESLADLFPEVAAKWDYEANGDLSPEQFKPFSNKRVGWRCHIADDHRWVAAVTTVTTAPASGCPYCRGLTGSSTNNLRDHGPPEVVAEWDYKANGDLRPEDLPVRSRKSVHWRCAVAEDHCWVTSVDARTGANKRGYPFCRGYRSSSSNNVRDHGRPEAVAQWDYERNHPLRPEDLTKSSGKRIWWRCEIALDHRWQATIADRMDLGNDCPCCSGRQVSVTNSLATLFPELAAQWHPTENGDLTPADVVAGAHNRRWWKCEAGPDHEWRAALNSRASGRGCPFCAGQAISVTNSLATLFPKVAAQWHPTENGDLTPSDVTAGTKRKCWWGCDVLSDHKWLTPIVNRTRLGHGCPHCTLIPRSAQEMRLAHELSALIDFDLEAHKIRFAGRLRDVDIVLDDLKVVVEFDGSYWHSKKVDKDREKTALMEEAGWQVIRVRERPLDSIHVNDVMVDTLAPAKTVADLVLDKIVEVTGTDVPQLDEYLASEGPWREAQALMAIRAYQAERAAKKAARDAKKDLF